MLQLKSFYCISASCLCYVDVVCMKKKSVLNHENQRWLEKILRSHFVCLLCPCRDECFVWPGFKYLG